MKATLHSERHGYVWNVVCGGQQIVTASTDPEHDTCRVLAERGLSGPIDFIDGSTGLPRMRFPSIEIAGRYRVADEGRDGLRLRPRREMPLAARRGSPKTALNGPAGPQHRTPETGLPEPTDSTGRAA